MLKFYGAFESTKIPSPHRDILGTTRHTELWASDLRLLRAAGIRDLRYPVPWHRVEPEPGVFDFRWMDGPMQLMERLGMDPVLDPIHHVSFPDWLTHGFVTDGFAERYAEFVGEVARRYPWVRRYTVFNEPLPTTVFASLMGIWPPFHDSDDQFVAMVRQVGRAICLASEELRRRNPRVQLVHIDTAEAHHAAERSQERFAEFLSERRFLFHDLILGRIDRQHALWPYLSRHGFTPDDAAWFAHHAAPFDVLGLDYYAHSEMEWRPDRKRGGAYHVVATDPHGFAEIASDYIDRFGVPAILGETNIRGTVADRISWLRFMVEQCEQVVASGRPLEGFCWFPSIDSTDWCHLCTRSTGAVDPQGIWWLEHARWERNASELSEWYGRLARGEATHRDLPAYEFGTPPANTLTGFLPLMRHWDEWRQPAAAEEMVA